MDYDTVDAELQDLSAKLRGADDATVAAEMARLKGVAARIEDETWRRRALDRIDKLPELVSGPPVGTSPQYERAVQIVGRVLGSTDPVDARIAEADRAASEIAELAAQAPAAESMTILRMNGSIARLLEDLRRGEA